MQATHIEPLISQAKQLLDRLERISADSSFAHRSSGLRGSLLRWLDQTNTSPSTSQGQEKQNAGDLLRLRSLLAASYEILEEAAKDIVR